MQKDTNRAAGAIDAGEALRDFSEQAHRVLANRLGKQGTSVARAKLLLFISHRGTVRSIDLVQGLGYAPRTVTEGIDALEQEGLVLRTQDKVDRRAKRIALTEAGAAALDVISPLLCDFAEQMFGVLDDAERRQLAGFLQRMRGRLVEMEAADGDAQA